MSTESRLRSIRSDLGISREKLAYLTGCGVCMTTIRNVETGRNRVTFGKAQLILTAVNRLLADAQRPTITMDDLQLELY